MTKEELIDLLDKKTKHYIEKTNRFNNKKTVLICTIDERSVMLTWAKSLGLYFDMVDCYVNENSIFHWFEMYGNNANYFISKNILNNDLLEKIHLSKIDGENIYIGPTSSAYFDLYEKRNIVYDNLDRITNCLNILYDDKSKDILINIIVRLLLPYQFHFDYVEEDFHQYYSNYFTWTDKEIYLDAGVSDGINVFEFVEKVNWKYESIFAVEADPNNYILANTNLSNIKNLELFNKALYSKEGVLKFLSTNKSSKRGNARVQSDGDVIVEALSGDSLNIKPTYIKMDIEGAEMDALEGFKKTIVSCKPKLAICTYHSQTDFWEVPLKIHELNPNYRIIVRNHEHLETLIETVAYAWED